MFLNIPLIADIITLQNTSQAKIDDRLIKANNKRIRHEFKVNDNVYVHNRHGPQHKLKHVWSGPFPMLQVHTNNTVTVRRSNNVVERLTIRRLKPSKA